ncbi:ABC transporter ATP-binding protein [Erwinia sp. V90_4]|jgi:peptide/nickel transport system ATP-binding protein|uniref:ABC transporter ATP-binding protein n=1 Tax=Erwinia TaxID=551 RepID=UPI000C18BF39|nr:MULTISPECIES: ABC transporter ATP-binding protein [Erwinia]PIJ59483.1 peptide ABC transporter ATP-binding protein [Erwinia sp. OLMDLW33]VTT27206.1 putative ABC transport system oligopeptide translocator [Klebsiella pneumoniae]MCP2232224.1 peptide/nickel transport system ATP-binding protein [Erwinia aphidicola]MDI3440477.1 ABC transporter ATP-binding protein [Erwinia sp. V90_4]CAH0282755.1 Glutathione import ATP-binding protein GsiA [Erwinia aphidicola]
MATDSSAQIVAESLKISAASGAELVKNISFTLGRERVALVGESGSGKSLTARALMGLLAPSLQLQARTLSIAGENGLTLNERRWSQLRGSSLGMVMQDPKYALNPMRTIGWQVAEPLRLHGRFSRAEIKEKVCEMLAAVGLPQPAEQMKRYPHQLSGGMGQRVMLAIALIAEPQFLIADEPTSALDHAMRDQVLALIRNLVEQRNMGLLLISHDLQQVSEHCERVMVMYQGEILDTLPAAELPHATHPYTRTLWSCRPNKSTHGKPLPVLDRAALAQGRSHD